MTEAPEPVRLIQMSLESGAVGPLVERASTTSLSVGHSKAVTELLSNRPEADVGVADSLLTWLVRPSALKALVTREPLDVASLDALLPRLSLEGYEYLLDALASSENRATRRRLVDRLSRTEIDIAPLVWRHLDDSRWYVQRNMLILLERAARIPEGFSAAPWVIHEDPRVRCEAIRLQLKLPYEREEAIVRALEDLDPRDRSPWSHRAFSMRARSNCSRACSIWRLTQISTMTFARWRSMWSRGCSGSRCSKRSSSSPMEDALCWEDFVFR